ncbi:MAG: hypothetical protein B9S32_12040 [Verrucomicrobia bacterium Tous-C9LFEB]|nr:MAG: hypothetical protein B9S32_12040 [Verrucomicrobia bacterium Tous-C9LFEB]
MRPLSEYLQLSGSKRKADRTPVLTAPHEIRDLQKVEMLGAVGSGAPIFWLGVPRRGRFQDKTIQPQSFC